MDVFKIDSHKLMYHVTSVNDWVNNKEVYPIYLEISPAGSCNHRCTFCALDFMEYRPRFLDTNILEKRIAEMSSLGIKSIMYAGEGEPLLHKDIARIINQTKLSGIDVALTTNAVFLTKELLNKTLKNISWIKVSINAGTKENYARIHRAHPGDFRKVIENLKYAVRLRSSKKYSCALGMQLLLLPENSKEVLRLAQLARSIGVNYLVIKPYSQHPFSKTKRYKNINYDKYLALRNKMAQLNNNKFNVVFRAHSMKKWDDANRSYQHCYALPFWSYIDSLGNVWGCSAYLGDKRFLYGNIYKNTFKQIWQGTKRKIVTQLAKNRLNTNNCRINCRMDEINRYLWELKHPGPHVNFI